jgi:Predicted nucleic acid-binding protein, contains PIN domain
MILVDTSVWVDHLRGTEKGLVQLLVNGEVLIHPLVIEELACGSLARRDEFLELLGALPVAPVASHYEVLDLIANEQLYATGLGAVDAHLIASARLAGVPLWSKDKKLSLAAARIGVGR